MWRTSLRRGCWIAFIAVVCSAGASAQTAYIPTNAEWEFSGFVGRSFGDKFRFPTPVTGEGAESSRTVGMQYDSGYLVGFRFNQNLNDHWNAEGEYSFANQRLRFTNLSPSIPELSLNHFLHNFTYSIGVLPFPLEKRFRPYGDLGLGAALFYLPGRVKKDALELDLPLRDSWQLVFHFGGGFRYLIRDQFALAVDFKDRLSQVPSYGLPPSAKIVNGRYQPGVSLHGLFQNAQLSFGLTYQWDEF